MLHRWARRAAVPVAAWLLTTGGHAQAPAVPEQRPTFRAGANYVRVDVYPTVGGRIVAGLTAADFDLREDGVPQKLDSVQFIDPGPPVPDAVKVEPNTVAQSLAAAADPRARLFVIFLDTYHLKWTSGFYAYQAFARMLIHSLGEHDVIAVMTPEMSATALAFGRRVSVIEEVLQRHFDISRSGERAVLDPDDYMYLGCYPAGDTAKKMIERRHEKLTLDALRDLVIVLGGIREDRKTVFAVSDGWVLTRPDSQLAVTVDGQAPQPPKIGVGPDGRIRVGGARDDVGSDRVACDQDRMRLAMEDHESEFQRMLDLANRANTSFYAVDLRGLMTTVSPGRELLRTLSSATDGTAVVDRNDVSVGIQRAVDDMRGYYLLGYYASNAKADGRFRSIAVSVKRPGIHVRARRGYLAPSEKDMAPPPGAVERVVPKPTFGGGVVEALAKAHGDSVVYTQSGYAWRVGADGAVRPMLWVVGEWDPSVAGRDEQWKPGADVSMAVTAPDKAAVETVKRTLTREARGFVAQVAVPPGRGDGDYLVRMSVAPAGATLGTTEALRVPVPKFPVAGSVAVGQPILFRRGPYSGTNWLASGDLRFRRVERARIEVSVVGPMTGSNIQLLDRSGKPLSIPVATSEREEGGVKVVTGELALAPLSVGDYVLEVAVADGATSKKALAAFRIIPQ
jgi:VWFA-related protein